MEGDKDTQTTETTSDFLIQMLTDEKNGQAFAREYLKAGFLSAAVDALYYARRAAGLTQAQVAEQLNTKQAAIARLEADTAGSMSLRRYVDFALACGVVPLNISLAPIDSVFSYVIANPEAPRTQVTYNAWRATNVQSEAGSVGDAFRLSFAAHESATTVQGTRFILMPNIAGSQSQPVQLWSSGSVTITISDPEKQKFSLTHSTAGQSIQSTSSMYKEAA